MEETVLKALRAGGNMRPGEIAEATGLSKDEVAKIVKKLVAEGKAFSPKRCFYAAK